MKKFVVDAGVVLQLAASGERSVRKTGCSHQRSCAHRRCPCCMKRCSEKEVPAEVARERLRRIGRMPIRLLGDAVLRHRAWEIADRLGWASTYDAEYVALTQLQADALVTTDRALARRVKGIVPVAAIAALRAKCKTADKPWWAVVSVTRTSRSAWSTGKSA